MPTAAPGSDPPAAALVGLRTVLWSGSLLAPHEVEQLLRWARFVEIESLLMPPVPSSHWLRPAAHALPVELSTSTYQSGARSTSGVSVIPSLWPVIVGLLVGVGSPSIVR